MERRDFMAGLTGTTIGATTAATANSGLRFKQAQSKSENVPLGSALRRSFAEHTVKPKKFPTAWIKNDPSDEHPNALSFSLNATTSFTVGALIFLITVCRELRTNHRSRSSLKNSGKSANAI
jgi:hypothetical protein